MQLAFPWVFQYLVAKIPFAGLWIHVCLSIEIACLLTSALTSLHYCSSQVAVQ